MRAILVAVALCAATACSLPGTSSPASPSPTGSPVAELDAQVPLPPAFPKNVPVYPQARLTAAAGFPSSASTSWGMEWETHDTVAKVQAWYQSKLNKGDWAMTLTTATATAFAATFTSKSNSHVNGTLAAAGAAGVTRIEMSLLGPPS